MKSKLPTMILERYETGVVRMVAGSNGRKLIIDQAKASEVPRLVATLGPDESLKVAHTVAKTYIADGRPVCRRVRSNDFPYWKRLGPNGRDRYGR
jgi:hypothetical protein